MTRTNLSSFNAKSVPFAAKELLVADDFSSAADTALKYAVMLSKRFGSFVHLVSVQTPKDYADALEGGSYAMETSQRDIQSELAQVKRHLEAAGIQSDANRRIGNVSDSIVGLTLELKPDLLMFGAFGHSATDRLQLGSTAEHLLRVVGCPALVIGPHAIVTEPEARPIQHILCATTSLESPDDIVLFAGHLADQMKAHLELFHAVDPAQQDLPNQDYENRCEEWSRRLRQQNISVSWTLLHGAAEQLISARAMETNASLILFALHRRGSHMIDCPDGVVSAAIRQAHCPVMTVPMGLPL
jgi:nucleotide-binding universal stress UspA family protein